MHVKLSLLLLYCCLVVTLKNAEVSNGLLKLKMQDKSRSIVDAVWKELSYVVRSEKSQCVDTDG